MPVLGCIVRNFRNACITPTSGSLGVVGTLIFDSSLVPGGAGTETASVRITTSTSQQDTDSLTYELIDGTPEELQFSPDTTFQELPHTLGQSKKIDVPLGSEGTEYEFKLNRRAERVEIIASSVAPHVEWDMNLVRQAFALDKFIRIKVKNEYETKEVTYDGKIEGDVQYNHFQQNRVSWSFVMIVHTRTETYISGLSGPITNSSQLSGDTVFTSANHGLKVGAEIRCFNMSIGAYDGVYLVIGIVNQNAFKINGAYHGSLATGEWIKLPHDFGEA